MWMVFCKATFGYFLSKTLDSDTAFLYSYNF